jgi:hypothetical protein
MVAGGRRHRARRYPLTVRLARDVDPGVDAGGWPGLGVGREGGVAVVPVARKPVSHPILCTCRSRQWARSLLHGRSKPSKLLT